MRIQVRHNERSFLAYPSEADTLEERLSVAKNRLANPKGAQTTLVFVRNNYWTYPGSSDYIRFVWLSTSLLPIQWISGLEEAELRRDAFHCATLSA
jgi:hypothetical protein